jgi:hypothetical protein
MAQNSTFIQLFIDDDKLIGEVSSSISTSMDVIDVSSKADVRAREILPGRIAESISFESLADDTNSSDYGYAAAYGAMVAGTSVAFVIKRVDAAGVQINGSQQIAGDGYITSLTMDNPDNDRSTMSGTLEIDDDIEITTYTAPE